MMRTRVLAFDCRQCHSGSGASNVMSHGHHHFGYGQTLHVNTGTMQAGGGSECKTEDWPPVVLAMSSSESSLPEACWAAFVMALLEQEQCLF